MANVGTVLTPNDGEVDIGEILSSMDLELWLVTAVSGGYDESTVAADLTEPSTTGTGYGRITLTGGTATTTGGDPTETTYPKVSWTLAASVAPIIGVAFVNPSSGRLRHYAPLTPAFTPDGVRPLEFVPRWTQS